VEPSHIPTGGYSLFCAGLLPPSCPTKIPQLFHRSEHRLNSIPCSPFRKHDSEGRCIRYPLTRGAVPLSKFEPGNDAVHSASDHLGRCGSGWGARSGWIAEGFVGMLGPALSMYSHVSEDRWTFMARFISGLEPQTVGKPARVTPRSGRLIFRYPKLD